MAEKYLFFNSTQDDRRRYQAADMAEYWRSFLFTGLIHRNFKPNLQVFANGSNREINIEPGKAIIAGSLYIRNKKDNSPYRIDDPDSLLDRIDRVVLRFDNRIEHRYIKAFIKKGEPAENPEPPSLDRVFLDDEDEPIIYELSLCQVRSVAGKSFIEQSDIIDERLDQSVCGLVHSLVEVPTDVFVEQWNKFVEEYTKWFTDLQGSSFATVEDVRNSENKIKREVANLNLQLEASKRVTNGVTYGTDFDTSFGMEIDLARTFSEFEVPAGITEIIVDDVRDFRPNTEVTIFDDANLERVKILDVEITLDEHKITLEKPLTKSFKAGANIARSMAIEDSFNKCLVFGVWGTYAYYNLTDNPTPLPASPTAYRKYAFLRMWDSWIYVSGLTVYRLRDGQTTWEEFKVYGDDTINEYVYVLQFRQCLVTVRMNRNSVLIVELLDKDGVLVNSLYVGEPTSGNTIFRTYGLSFENGYLTVYSSYSWEYTLRLIKIDNDYSLETLKIINYKNSGNESYPNTTTGTDSMICNYFNGMLTVVHLTRSLVSGGTGNDDRVVLTWFTPDEQRHTRVIQNVSGTTGLSVLSFTGFKLINGVYVGYLLAGSSFYKITSVNDNTSFIHEEITLTGDYTGTVARMLYWDYDNINLLLFTPYTGVYRVNTFDNTTYRVDNFNAGNNSYRLCPAPHFSDKIDQYFIAHQTASGVSSTGLMRGKGILGYGNEILTNDVRFKIKPTKEAVIWLQHNSEVSIPECSFGPLEMDKAEVEGETQYTGVSINEYDEIRFTMTRKTVDDDSKITRLLGGLE